MGAVGGAVAGAVGGLLRGGNLADAYALMIQGIAAEESGDKALAASIYPKIVQEDASRGSAEKLRADALEGVTKVQAARGAHGPPPTCK